MMKFKAVALTLATCLTAWTGAGALEKVRFAQGSPWNAGEAFMIFGSQLGFFADEGIELVPEAVQGSAVMLPQFSAGHLDFGLPPPDLLVVAAAKGDPFPVRMVFNYYSASAFEFVVPAASPIGALADLKGKKLGVGALTWGNLPTTRAMLADAGITWQTDVTPIPVGLGPAAWAELKSGRVDALNLFVGQHEMMRMTGMDIRRLPVPEAYARIFGNGVVASDRIIQSNPKQVEGMTRAIARSMVACRDQLENCVRAYWAYDPASRPAPEKETESLTQFVTLNQAALDKAFQFQTTGAIGAFRDADWQRLIAVMTAGGQVGGTPVDPARLYTNAFVAAANGFDMATTLERARSWKPAK